MPSGRRGSHIGEIALVGLDDRQLRATRSTSGASSADALGHLFADPVTQLASSRGEDLVEQVVAADRLDGGEQAGGQRVVVRWEEVLRFSRDVVQVARPADAMPHGLARDKAGGLERPELLEDAGAARAEAFGELIGRARTIEPEAQQEVATKGRRTAGRSRPWATGGTLAGSDRTLGSGIATG